MPHKYQRRARRGVVPVNENGETTVINSQDVDRTVAYVNRGRQRMAERLQNIELFTEPQSAEDWRHRAQTKDSPLVQTLFALRDELRSIELNELTTIKERQLRVIILSKIADISTALTTEANRASVELQTLRENEVNRALRIKEHADKMKIARDKAGGLDLEAMLAEDEDAGPTTPPLPKPRQ